MTITTDQMRVYMRDYRAKRREAAKKKLGDVCSVCGSDQNLEFDHIDRTTKIDSIANLLTNSKDTLKSELDKCQLLCKDCHQEKSLASGDLIAAKHGIGKLYARGCRCEVCVTATKEYRRNYYLEHGK